MRFAWETDEPGYGAWGPGELPVGVAEPRETLEDEEPLVREHAAWALDRVPE